MSYCHLKTIAINGYEGIAHEPGIVLDDLRNLNFIVGPNNAGKSSIFRFLSAIQDSITPKKAFAYIGLEGLPKQKFWRNNPTRFVSGYIAGSTPGTHVSAYGGHLFIDNEWRFDIFYGQQDQHQYTHLAPQVFFDTNVRINDEVLVNHWVPSAVLTGDRESILYLRMGDKQGYYSESQNEALLQHLPVYGRIFKKLQFFSAFRKISEANGGSIESEGDAETTRASEFLAEASGLGVLEELHEFSLDEHRADEYADFKKEFLSKLNGLLGPSHSNLIEDIFLKGTDKPRIVFTCLNRSVDLWSMGLGVAELTLLLFYLLKGKRFGVNGSPHIYFLEEPEAHLHPALLRRFIRFLGDYPQYQFFINTHSGAVLDMVTSDDRVFEIRKTEDGRSIAVQCTNYTEQQSLIDSLGVTASSLLQANSCIWVEGPSDRILIKCWLGQFATSKQVELVEGSDYAFAFYGGSILSHFDLSIPEEEERDLISMLSVNRYSAVLMDRDAPPNAAIQKLKAKKFATKSMVLKSSLEDSIHRFACITDGREIENDIPWNIFAKAIADVLKIETEALLSLKLPQENSFIKEIPNLLADPSLKEKLGSAKIKLAKRSVELMTAKDAGQPCFPSYIQGLYDLVVRSREPDKIAFVTPTNPLTNPDEDEQ